MTEAALMEAIRRMCGDLRLDAFHAHDSRRSWGPGFPDLVIVGERILYRECKGRDGVLQPHQRAWGSRITKAGNDWAVWRPRDLTSGQIASELASISGLAIARCITPDYTEGITA